MATCDQGHESLGRFESTEPINIEEKFFTNYQTELVSAKKKKKLLPASVEILSA